MARNLAAKQNVEPVDGDFPYGRIRDNDGSGNGTPVNEAVYGDFHQFFARMFAKSGITYNNQPDSEYTGFQFYEAANKLWKRFDGVVYIDDDIILNFDDHYNKLLVVEGTVANIEITLLNSAVCEEGHNVVVLNNSGFRVRLRRSSPDTIMGDIFYKNTLFPNDFAELALDKANKKWFTVNVQSLPSPIVATTDLSSETDTSQVGVFKFTNIINNPDSVFDSTTGKITPIKAGWYEINFSGMFRINAVLSSFTVLIDIRKNGVAVVNAFQQFPYGGSGERLPINGSKMVYADGLTDYFEVTYSLTSSETWIAQANMSCKFIKE